MQLLQRETQNDVLQPATSAPSQGAVRERSIEPSQTAQQEASTTLGPYTVRQYDLAHPPGAQSPGRGSNMEGAGTQMSSMYERSSMYE